MIGLDRGNNPGHRKAGEQGEIASTYLIGKFLWVYLSCRSYYNISHLPAVPLVSIHVQLSKLSKSPPQVHLLAQVGAAFTRWHLSQITTFPLTGLIFRRPRQVEKP